MSDAVMSAKGTTQLLMGNEAIARGALEAGIGVATAYPGNPSTEIIDTLARVAKDLNIYVEWSINEKVALEVAAAASFSGVRAITAMKQNGLNVALDFLSNLNLTGTKSGLVLVVCDDPGAVSSTNEQDSRHVAKALDLPLLEPATPQEAKDMTKWAVGLSEEIANVCLIRSVTRISHARANVVLGKLPRVRNEAYFDTLRKPYCTTAFGEGAAWYHKALHQKLTEIRKIYESSAFNWYAGPEQPELLIITSGSGWLYSQEAIKMLSLGDSVAILKLGTTWPLPNELVKKHMLKAEKVLVVEEVDSFLEDNIKELTCDLGLGARVFYGKSSGHINPFGEVTPDMVIKAVASILNIGYMPREEKHQRISRDILKECMPPRGAQFCAGCPYRSLFWAIKNALRLDGRNGVLAGDIGCYGMAIGPTGFFQLRNMHSMGSGVGIACGLGKLGQFGFEQRALAACGDSTFFHAAIPALINGIHSRSNFILLFLDNAGTAMTGFQPHPGIGIDAVGDPAPAVNIEALCNGLGIPVAVVDSRDVKATTEKLLDILQQDESGVRVLVCRGECALIQARKGKPLYKVHIASDSCVGEACGCDRYCTRVFKCPGLIWDRYAKKARIDEAICVGCGVCVDICTHSAIKREAS